ncbi:unnamed protein product [Tetraodon nigroviridis]|uniref:(spotted green pufferfish) hypothetical protein n=1 Tax=Tetraodon nigroviridis TaxID=99883 RepID=Q4STQ2_TETNG|nr:unnamed protein product [Tetraodon nigroviridis]
MAAFESSSQQICEQLTRTSSVQEKMIRDEERLSLEEVQREILAVSQRRRDLLVELEGCEDELQQKRAQTAKLRRKFKTCVKVPPMDINFQHSEEQEGGDVIRGEFTISQKPSMRLRGGEALITFEKESVTSQIRKAPEFSVSCDQQTLTVKPKEIKLHPAVRFEVRLDVSRRQLKLSNVDSSFAEDRIKDRLEMSFSKASRGGGEVEGVEYDENTGTAVVTFLQPGVALSLAQAGTFPVDLEARKLVEVEPVVKTELHKFQTFCAVPKTTVLLSGIEDVDEESNLQDCLQVYFQKPSRGGGEISHIRYISKRKSLQAFFTSDNVPVVDKSSG